jgi:hypothetical protein
MRSPCAGRRAAEPDARHDGDVPEVGLSFPQQTRRLSTRELPVDPATTLRTVTNMKTTKSICVVLSQSLLLQASEIVS